MWTAGVVLAALLAQAGPADADWLVTPFIGARLDTKTNLVLDLDRAAADTGPVFGVSVSHVTRGVLGFEGDLGYAPGIFDASDAGGLVSGSRVATLTGQALFSAPSAVVRDSLRPYLSLGGGWMHVGMTDLRGVLGMSENYGVIAVGAGATGRTGRRTSIRFDLRRFQNVTDGRVPTVAPGRPRLSFWRASVGLALHY